MRCSSCNQTNEDSNSFCIKCGAPLSVKESEALAEEDVSLVELHDQVQFLQQEVSDIQTTLASHGMTSESPVIGTEPVQHRQQPQPRPQSDPRPRQQTVVWEPALATTGGPPTGPPDRSDVAAQPEESFWDKNPIDWEMILGGNWLARIGILALVVGMGFFLKMAFDNDWIGETGRVVLGISAGLAFLGAGEYWRTKYPVYAQALVGGGIAMLYLSLYAAYAIFGLISLYPGVGMLALISVASAALAIRYESVSLAVIGILGAFLAPIATSGASGNSTQVQTVGPSFQLMAYVIVIDLGVLALSTFRSWRWFTMLALIGSLFTFGNWYMQYEQEISVLTAQLSLTLIFLIFAAATTLFHMIWRREPKVFDMTLMILNATAFFGISYGILWDDFREWMGGFTIVVALFYGGMAYLALTRTREQVKISLMALGIALIMLTIAVPVQLGGPWISIAWAAEAVILLGLSYTLHMWQLRVYSVGIFGLFLIWLFAIDTIAAVEANLTPLANEYLPMYLFGVAAMFLGAYLARRYGDKTIEEEVVLFPALLVAGNVILTVAVPIQVDPIWVAVTWAAEAAALVWFSFRLNIIELRLISIGVFATLFAWLLVIDTPIDLREFDSESGQVVSKSFTLFLNYRMMAFVSGITALYGAVFMIYRVRESLHDWEKKELFVILLIAANFLTLWVLSAEVIAAVDSRIINVSGRTADHVTSLSLSLVWAIYASLILIVGIISRQRYVRLAGLGLLAIPVIKLFLVDSFALERGYRVAAFMSLGGILLVGGFLYQRFTTVIKGFFFETDDTAPQN
jgi:uncharacterized membrane protein